MIEIQNDFNYLWKSNLDQTRADLAASVGTDQLLSAAVHAIDDELIVQNMLAKRLREWYEWHLPEFSHAIASHEAFARLIVEKSKPQLLTQLNRKDSMGAEFDEKDLQPVLDLARELSSLNLLAGKHAKYIEATMAVYAPNLVAVAGSLIGAKLLARAGSLKRLAELPSSTIQLLGAEKALFRHLINKKSRPPKHGLIHEHAYVNKSKNPGKAARELAAKIAIAAKVDYFHGAFIGDELKGKLDARSKK